MPNISNRKYQKVPFLLNFFKDFPQIKCKVNLVYQLHTSSKLWKSLFGIMLMCSFYNSRFSSLLLGKYRVDHKCQRNFEAENLYFWNMNNNVSINHTSVNFKTKTRIQIMHNIEKYIAIKNDKLKKHEIKWKGF